jgi:hypothetical protein
MSKIDYYSEAAHGPHEIFDLGNYQLESGVMLPAIAPLLRPERPQQPDQAGSRAHH